MTLNAARTAVEDGRRRARGSAAARGARASAARRSTSRSRASEPPRGQLHLMTQIRREIEDVFLGLGYEVFDGREVETSSTTSTRSTCRRRTRRARRTTRSTSTTTRSCGRTPRRADPHRWTRASRRSTWSRPAASTAATRRTRRTRRRSTRSSASPSTAASRSPTCKGTLLHFFRALFGQEREVRMRTSFFPFTEPSVEFDVTCFLCERRRAAAVCKHSGWIEMGGAGIVDPARLRERRLRPRGVVGLRVRPRHRADRACSGTASPTCGRSGRTTCAC